MKRVFILLLACAAVLVAQTTSTVFLSPDCILPFNLITAGSTLPPSSGFNNRQVGCNIWQIQYAANGFTALTLTLQAAPDNNGAPGTWATMSATPLFGVNPNTSTTGASALLNSFGATFPPWVRVRLDAATGTGSVVGIAFGFRQAVVALTAGGGGGGGNGVVVPSGCTQQQLFNLAAAGNTRIINAGGTGTVHICEISFSTTAAEDIKITEGTGTNCGTGSADVTGLYKSVQSIVLDPQVTAAISTQTAGDDVCLNQSAAQALGGLVVFAKF